MRNALSAIVVISAMCAGCGSDPEPAATDPEAEAAASMPEPLPGLIVAERGGFIPEGVEYDTTNGRLLIGSLAEGSIFQIHGDGRLTTIVTDAELVSSIGIEADEPRGRLLVANSDSSVFQGESAGQAKLGVYDLSSGERIAMVDLAASLTDAFADAVYFANDVAVGDDGTAYVTDTRMNVIYQVDGDYNASVLHRFSPTEDLGLNGIVYHASGYLLVAGGTTLWKVPVADPTETTWVRLPEATAGHDGMLWTADGRLAIVSNSENRVIALTSGDEWATAQLAGVATFEGQATTAADVNGEIYVVHPHFADADPPSVERVTFQ
ncbi:MAG: SMP-30/gluconolactonase/LRE family protein [Acidobacteria bacterium]|nr:SMP-30/gluconolactonase/LRE family protein [Acidobacteriota bacterium]